MADELTLLKERAALMGINHSPNIGLEALKKKVAAVDNDEPEDQEEAPVKAKKEETVQQEIARIRAQQMRDEMKLIRVRIANMNPAKAELKGEIVTVANKFVGTVRKFVPFGEAGEAYHLPKILVDELRSREFNLVRTRTDRTNGQTIIEQKLVREYSIEELAPLTADELKELARMQAAAAGQ